MTSTLTADPRTELVLRAADDVDHIFCEDCWTPGMPMLCGEPDPPGEAHPDDCGHPECPMCAAEWARHWPRHLPGRQRWLS